MKAEKFYLFRGEIWFVHPDSRATKTYFAPVSQFIGDLCANPDNMDTLFDQHQYLVTLLSCKNCSIVQQLQVDADVIEVRNCCKTHHWQVIAKLVLSALIIKLYYDHIR